MYQNHPFALPNYMYLTPGFEEDERLLESLSNKFQYPMEEPLIICGLPGTGKTDTAIAFAQKVFPDNAWLLPFRGSFEATIADAFFQGYAQNREFTKNKYNDSLAKQRLDDKLEILGHHYAHSAFIIADCGYLSHEEIRSAPVLEKLMRSDISLIVTTCNTNCFHEICLGRENDVTHERDLPVPKDEVGRAVLCCALFLESSLSKEVFLSCLSEIQRIKAEEMIEAGILRVSKTEILPLRPDVVNYYVDVLHPVETMYGAFLDKLIEYDRQPSNYDLQTHETIMRCRLNVLRINNDWNGEHAKTACRIVHRFGGSDSGSRFSERFLDMQKMLYASNDQELAQAFCEAGYSAMNNLPDHLYATAYDCFLKAISIAEKNMPQCVLELADAKLGAADIMRKYRGRKKEAEKFESQALKLLKNNRPADKESLVNYYTYLANEFYHVMDRKQREKYANQAYSVMLQMEGTYSMADEVYTLLALSAEDHSLRLEYAEKSLAFIQKNKPWLRVKIFYALLDVADCHEAIGQYAEACSIMEQALQLLQAMTVPFIYWEVKLHQRMRKLERINLQNRNGSN